MPQIKILPPGLRDKIAAGEVIERPASVVKELIENSIDGESTEIKIEVFHGGKLLIRVSDNGIGMDKEDALLCFRRHATSKLLSEEDLFNIRTMGFRGEALSSIASVSKVKIVTAPKGSSQGVSVEIHGGEVKAIKDSPTVGTAVEVRDLFFNTPARRKFLKTNKTELLHILDRVTEEALAHYEIGFSFTSDKHESMHIPTASSLRERIMQIYGDEFLHGLTEIHAETGDMRMQSFISKIGNFRNTRAYQYIFLNRRPVKDPSIAHAIYSAYEGTLPNSKHPVFSLSLDMDPKRIDFNVHPTKREVRFADKESVYRFIHASIRNGMYTPPSTPHEPSAPSTVSENLELAYQTSPPFLYLGNAFIAVSGKGGLTLIDQHAAHERILYEKFLKGIELESHRLLFPGEVKLSHKEYRVILEHTSLLRDFGIEVDDFGYDSVIVRSLPDALKKADIRGILSDLASSLLEGIPPGKDMKEALAAKIACHSSVRGKIVLSQEEVSRLVSDLEACAHPESCPHGRPTRISFSLDKLKKIFKRT